MSTTADGRPRIRSFNELHVFQINNSTYLPGYNKLDATTYRRITTAIQKDRQVTTPGVLVKYMAYEPELLKMPRAAHILKKMDATMRFLVCPWNLDSNGEMKTEPHLTNKELQDHREQVKHVVVSTSQPQAETSPPLPWPHPTKRQRPNYFPGDMGPGLPLGNISSTGRLGNRSDSNTIQSTLIASQKGKPRADDLRQKKEDLAKENQCLRDQIVTLTEQRGRANSQLQSSDQTHETQPRTFQVEITLLRERVRALDVEKRATDANVHRLREQVRTVEGRNRELTAVGQAMAAQVVNLRQELQDTRTNVVNLQIQHECLNEDLNNVKDELHQKTHTLKRHVQHGAAVADEYLNDMYSWVKQPGAEQETWQWCLSQLALRHNVLFRIIRPWVESGRQMEDGLPKIDDIPPNRRLRTDREVSQPHVDERKSLIRIDIDVLQGI